MVAVAAGVVLATTEPGLTAPVVALHATSGVVDAPQGWAPEFTDDKGRPARWDPCLPIHYVVDSRYAPPGGLADVQEAVAQVSKATGMTFVDDGATLEMPQRAREAYQPGHYGRHWAPVLIAWVPPSGTDLLTDPDAEGVTVPIAVPTASGGVIVTAEVALNTARALPPGFGRGGSEGEVLLHELGHVVGLAHVSDPAQAMYPMARGLAAYGEGDLAGLTALGRSAGCLPEPAPHHLTTSSTPTG